MFTDRDLDFRLAPKTCFLNMNNIARYASFYSLRESKKQNRI